MPLSLPRMADPAVSTWELALDLPPEVKVGQCLMIGFPGPTVPASLAGMLADGLIGGVILFRRNIQSPPQLRALCDEIHGLCPSCPPLVSIDQEGGLVTRFAPPFTTWPHMRDLGHADSEDLARRMGLGMGRELAAVGIDIDFAPVVDVNTNPKNPIIGIRAVGDDAAQVTRIALAVMEGLNEAGVIPCAKHFPGHGHTALDSHKDLPVIDLDKKELHATHLAPFVSAIAASCPMIMTAHVLYRALDRYYPATVSRRILTDLLRDELGFDGVIITDAMEMEGVRSILPGADAAYAALKAGCDILLYGEGGPEVEEIRESLVLAMQRAALLPQEMDAAARRILDLKRNRLLHPPPDSGPEWIGHADHAATARAIRDAAQS